MSTRRTRWVQRITWGTLPLEQRTSLNSRLQRHAVCHAGLEPRDYHRPHAALLTLIAYSRRYSRRYSRLTPSRRYSRRYASRRYHAAPYSRRSILTLATHALGPLATLAQAASGAPTLSFRRTMSWCLPPPARRATPLTTMGRASSARMGPRATRAALPIRPTASRPAPEDEQPCFTSPPPRVHTHMTSRTGGARRG